MVVDVNEFERFFSLVYGTSKGYIDLVTKSEEGVLDSERFFRWDEQKTTVSKYSALRAEEDLYCSVGLFSAEERTKDDPQAVARVVFADLDTCHPDNLRIPPTIIVETSPDRWHGWWVLDEEVPLKAASEAARRIYEAHKDKGVDRGWIASKLLRVPGTTNTKYDEPFEVRATYNDIVYTLDTINDVYGDVEIAPSAQSDGVKPKPVSRKERIELEKRLDAAGLTSLYLDKPKEGQSWSERAYKLELELFRLGMTPREVFSLMLEAACNKYNPAFAGEVTQTGVPIPKRRNPDEVLWQEVVKAHAEYQETANVIVDESINVRKRIPAQQFLSIEERKWVHENPSFIDHYVDWVASKTDASQTYSRSLGWLLLSIVFGARGYLPLRWGRTELNLWVLILGDTTRTRKSTAKNLFMQCVHRFETQSGQVLDIGSDATGEALLKLLPEKDGTVSLLHVDEVNGWFNEMYGKNYRVGTLEKFTELYDGKVPVVLRATKEAGNTKRARTAFCFVGVGIRAETAEILTQKNFRSGFLARMLWSVADPPPRRPGSEDIEFEDDTTIARKFDPVMDDMVADLVRRVRKWPLTNPSAMKMTDEAKARYNRWAESAMQIVERHGDSDILSPSFKRLGDSVAKAAALLAMYDQADEIHEGHLLHALLQAESWFNDMVRMASEISSSDFERRLNEVEAFIMAGENQTRLESAIRRKFSRFRPRDMEEILTALKQSGRIKGLSGQKVQALA